MQSFDRCRYRISPVFPLSQHSYSRDLDFHNFSSPGSLKLRMIRSTAPLQKAHHWSRFCCDSFFSWILLKSFRHCFRANCRSEMADIEQAQQMIPLITCETYMVSTSASWFLVSMYLFWILGSKLIRSKNQSRATLWVLETCLIVGILPFIIILITASLFSNTYNKASWCED